MTASVTSTNQWSHDYIQNTHTHRLIVFYPLTLPHRETEWHTASRCVVTEAWWIAQNRKAIYINHKGAKSKRGARTVLHKLPRHHVTIPSSDFPLIGRRWHLKGITGERSGPRGCPAGDAPRIGFPGRRQGSCCKYCWQWRRPTGGSPAGQTRCPTNRHIDITVTATTNLSLVSKYYEDDMFNASLNRWIICVKDEVLIHTSFTERFNR